MRLALAPSPHEHTRRLRARNDLSFKALLGAGFVIALFAVDVAHAKGASLAVAESADLNVTLTVAADKAPTFQVYKASIGSDGVVYVVELPGAALGDQAITSTGPGVLLDEAHVEAGRKGAADRVVLSFADDVDYDASTDKGVLAVQFHHTGDRAALMAAAPARAAARLAAQKGKDDARAAFAAEEAAQKAQKEQEAKELARLAALEQARMQELEAAKKAEAVARAQEAERLKEIELARKADEARVAKELEEKKHAEALRVAAEAQAKKQAELARKAAEVEAKKQAEAARIAADVEAKRLAKEAKIKAELDAKKAIEDARLKAAALAQQKIDEAKKKADDEAKLKELQKLDAEKRKAAELALKKQAEAEAAAKLEEQKKQAALLAKQKADDAVRAEAARLEAQKKAAAEEAARAEAARVEREKEAAIERQKREDAARADEAEQKRQARLDAERRARADEERRIVDERRRAEEARVAAEAEARRVAAERRRLIEEQQKNEERRQLEQRRREQERALAKRAEDAGFGGGFGSIELSRPNRYARYTPPRDEDGFGGSDDGADDSDEDVVDETEGRSVFSKLAVQRTADGSRVGVVVDGGARYQVTRRGKHELVLTLFDTRALNLDVRRSLDARSLGTNVLRVSPSVDEGDRFRVQLIIETRGSLPVKIDQDGKTLWLEISG